MKSPASYLFIYFFLKVPALLQLPLSTSWVLCRAKHIGSVFTEVSQVQSHITECECKWLILAGDMLNELKNRGNRTPNEYK